MLQAEASDVDHLRDQLAKATSNLADITNQHTALAAALPDLQNQLSDVKTTTANLTSQQLPGLAAQVSTLQQSADRKLPRLKGDIEQGMAESRTALQQLNKQSLPALETRIALLETALTAFETQFRSVTTTTDSKTSGPAAAAATAGKPVTHATSSSTAGTFAAGSGANAAGADPAVAINALVMQIQARLGDIERKLAELSAGQPLAVPSGGRSSLPAATASLGGDATGSRAIPNAASPRGSSLKQRVTRDIQPTPMTADGMPAGIGSPQDASTAAAQLTEAIQRIFDVELPTLRSQLTAVHDAISGKADATELEGLAEQMSDKAGHDDVSHLRAALADRAAQVSEHVTGMVWCKLYTAVGHHVDISRLVAVLS